VNIDLLKNHIKLCKTNLKRDNIKCCLSCPFEEEIVKEYPEMADMFHSARVYNEARVTNNPFLISSLSKLKFSNLSDYDEFLFDSSQENRLEDDE